MRCPILYEIHTRVWLRELSAKASARITLANVPEEEIERWASLGFTHIWLMGIWTTGPRALAQARTHWERFWRNDDEGARVLSPSDVLASPYAIAAYEVCDEVGGDEALRRFRFRLRQHGLGLILDFVPNHTGLDHAWLSRRPGLFVHGAGLPRDDGTFEINDHSGSRAMAHGRDPYFPPWTDTAQLDYRCVETHRVMVKELERISDLCDGVRCDMAMLLLRKVFDKTWRHFPCHHRETGEEFWPAAIAAVRHKHPHFLFIAEAYWDLEPELLEAGFDFTYNKRVYDYLIRRDPKGLRSFLCQLPRSVLERGVHFLENHDEKRIAGLLSPSEHRVAALLMMALPGLRFLYEGQIEGARRFSRIQFGRRLAETEDVEVSAFYRGLLAMLPATAVGKGNWQWMPASAGGSTANEILIALEWQDGARRTWVVVNLSNEKSDGLVPWPADGFSSAKCDSHQTPDPLEVAPAIAVRMELGSNVWEASEQGIHLLLEPHGAVVFEIPNG